VVDLSWFGCSFSSGRLLVSEALEGTKVNFAEWERKLGIRRTVVLGVTLWMTWKCFQWANDYAEAVLAASGDALGAAAIIAAVTAPVSVLQGYVFKAYIESK
jgi:hypothetical protein